VSPAKMVTLLIGLMIVAVLMFVPLSRDGSPSVIGIYDKAEHMPPNPGEQPPSKPADIHVNVSLTEEQFELLLQANRNFMMKYPHIQVKLTNEPDQREGYASWMLQSRQGEAADILLLDNRYVLPYAVQGYLQPVDSIIMGDAGPDQLSALLDPLRWNGYLWGMPKDADPYIIVWNEELLKAVGLKEPPADWSSFEAAAAHLLELDQAALVLNWSAGDLLQQLTWLARYDESAERLLALAPYGKRQLERLASMRLLAGHIGSIQLADLSALAEAFVHNRLLAAIMPWSQYEQLEPQVRKLLLVDQESPTFAWLGGRSYVVTSGSAYEEEALLWISAMTELHLQQADYAHFGLLPVRASLYTGAPAEMERQERPPAWWGEELARLPFTEPLPAPDPDWMKKWLAQEELWANVAVPGGDWEAYLAAVAKAG
jgi:ABC-type glycerol-3-phosphate transport system substrate-binding protein